MNEDHLLDSVRVRIKDPGSRIDMTTIRPPRIYPAVTAAALSHAEALLGCELPSFLRRLYLEVANGGFGPGAGLLGLDGGHANADEQTLTACYASFRSYGWPENLLPAWDWGDGAWSCVDASTAEGRIVTHDEGGPTPTRFSLSSWLEAWVGGVDLWEEIYETESGLIVNPFTKKMMTVKRRGSAKRPPT